MTGNDTNAKGTRPMTTKTKTSVRVRVEYWCGTTQMTGTAMTYRGAMRLAAKNRNAYSPKFYDGNRELLDDVAVHVPRRDRPARQPDHGPHAVEEPLDRPLQVRLRRLREAQPADLAGHPLASGRL